LTRSIDFKSSGRSSVGKKGKKASRTPWPSDLEGSVITVDHLATFPKFPSGRRRAQMSLPPGNFLLPQSLCLNISFSSGKLFRVTWIYFETEVTYQKNFFGFCAIILHLPYLTGFSRWKSKYCLYLQCNKHRRMPVKYIPSFEKCLLVL